MLSPFDAFDQALREVNDSRYGLQAGIFTRDLYKAQKAWDELEVGGVLIGDVPSFRVDHMPYGDVEDSGLGREGVRYAIDERNAALGSADAAKARLKADDSTEAHGSSAPP